MKFTVRSVALFLLVICGASAIEASTIIKLNLGDVSPDISMNALGVLGTVDDGDAVTTGNQNTDIEYTGFLEPLADINLASASFTLSGLQSSGPVQQLGSFAIQNFSGGQISLYDSSNTLLLTGLLSGSILNGVIGPPGTAALFTTGLGSVTAGSLKPFIADNSLSLSMSLTNLNDGAGLSVSDGLLGALTADATLAIAADSSGISAPEPSSLILVALG